MQVKYHLRPNAGTPKQVYLLDLDNTLHAASRFILPEINRQMTRYIEEQLDLSTPQASALRTQYWMRYGATLLGLIKHHGVDPHHFLAETHRLQDFPQISGRHASVPRRLARLNGIRILFTNAPRAYAVDLCRALGLYRYFHAIVAIEDMQIHRQWRPKPSDWLWANVRAQLKTRRLMLVDDTLGHLNAASRRGIQTAWITSPGLGFKPLLPTGRVKKRIRQFDQIRRHAF
ncbi:HAD family hydrolase [Limnobacter sp.]|uniref:HAD family hydrolase n=1 Tax=Limnobacter sp. TaxID=2003368 RepID=UPI0025898EF1|nr:HAD family hydrolase [Limnobacter sp.]